MKKKDILGLIGTDLTRSRKKPKKRLDDFLVGEEDRHEKVMRDKRSKEEQMQKKKNSLMESIGASHGEEKASKPNVELLDFGALNKMSSKEQVKTLKREYLNLIDKLEETASIANKEQSGKGELQIELEKYKREAVTTQDFIRELVGYIPNAHDLKVQMDTTAWDIATIEVEVTSKLKSLVNKVKFVEKTTQDELKDALAQRKALENELYKTKEELKRLKESNVVVSSEASVGTNTTQEEEKVDESVSRVEKTERDVKASPFDSRPTPAVEDVVEIEVPEITMEEPDDDLPKYVFMDVDRYLENLPENGKYILKVIGETGISRNSELKKHIEDLDSNEAKKHFYSAGKFDYNQLSSAVKLLKDRQFLNSQEVNLGARGHKFPVYELSDIGKSVYYKSTQLKPVEPESAQILRDHKSLEHGYLIKECAIEFREMGYTVYEDREHCTYKLKNGKRKVFDLIIEKDGEKKHIEVERGTHNDDDFLTAMDKIYEVTNDMYFVAPTQKILYSNTKGKVFKWITDRLGGFEKAKGKIKMNFATFENIKKRQKQIWEEFKL